MKTQPILVADQPPPSNYYAENLSSVISRVMSLYGDLLDERAISFGGDALALSTDASRLFARLCTRKGLLFRVDSLNYQEISNLEQAITELVNITFLQSNPKAEIEDVLRLFSRVHLQNVFPTVSKSGSRVEYIERLIGETSTEEIFSKLTENYPYVSFDVRNQVDIFSLLFFGNVYEDLSTFVLRDLGLRHYESYEISANTRLFDTKESLNRYLALLEQSATYEEERVDATVEQLQQMASTLERKINLRASDRLRSHILNRVGHDLERRKEFESAISVYKHSSVHPARERTVRCYKRLGCEERVQQSLNEIKDQPWTTEEREFADTFGTRFNESELCPVKKIELCKKDETTSIEDHAINWLRSSGSSAWHLENALPTSLFAITYWEWIFAPVKGAFVNEFQTAPLDFYWPDFFDKRSEICDDPLNRKELLTKHILETARRKRNLSCVGMAWEVFTDEFLTGILNAISVINLHKILIIMKKDLRQMSSGFPDLTVIHSDNSIEFIEVKGPGDRLQLNQRIWIRYLVEHHIPVSVLRFS